MNLLATSTEPASDPIALRPYPSKLFVEVTTRCNLRCGMCVKETSDSGIVDGDLAPETFDALEPALSQTETLILNSC